MVFLFASNASADQPWATSVDGRLFQTGTSNPLKDPTLSFTLQILNPSKNCVLYEETQVYDTNVTNGYFSLKVGSAAPDLSGRRTSNDPGYSMARIFNNTLNSFPSSAGCSGGYSPADGDARYLRVSIDPTSGASEVLSPDIALNSVPSAKVAETVGGLSRAELLQVNTSGVNRLDQTNLQAVFNTTQLPILTALLGGTSSLYMRQGANGAATLPGVSGNASSATPGQIWYDTATNTMKYQSNSGPQVLGVAGAGITGVTAGTGLNVGAGPGGTISTSGTLNIDVGSGVGQIVQVQTGGKLPAVSGADLTNLNGSAINSGTIGGTTSVNTSGTIQAGAITSSGAISGATVSATGSISGASVAATGAVTAASLTTTGSVSSSDVRTNSVKIFKPSTLLNVELVADAALSSSLVFTLPTTLGTNGQVLQVDNAGKMSWTTITGVAPGGSAGGDLGGNYPNPDVVKIRGNAVASGALAVGDTGKVYRWSGTQFEAVNFGIDDLRTEGGLSQFATNCNSNQTLTWSVITDAFACTPISINANQITAGTIDAARLPVVGVDKGGSGLSALGTANQVLGVNAAGNAAEYKAITAGAGVTVSHSAGGIQISAAGTGGTVTNVTGSGPIGVATGTTTPVISISQATTSTDGYLNSTDWNTFNNKQTAGAYLTGLTGDVAATGPGSVAATIQANAITTGKINDAAVTTNKINDGAVTANKLGALAVTDAKINDVAWSKITGTPTSLSGYGIADSLVTNGGGTPSITSATEVTRPAAGIAGRLFVATDTHRVFRDTGSVWEQLTVNASDLTTGTLPTARLPGFTGDVTSSAGSNSITLNTVPLTKGGTGLTAGGTGNQVLGMNNLGTAAEYKNIVAGSGVTVTPSAGAITITATGSGGTVTSVSGNGPISVASGTTTPSISISQANTTTDGFLSFGDWNTFNNKQPAGSYMTALTGDVVAAGPGSAGATIQANAITTGKINDGAVTTSKLNDGSVTTLKLNDGSVTTNKLGALSVTDAKINDVAWGKITGTPTSLSGYGIADALVANGGGTPSISSATEALRPAAGTAGRIFVATDSRRIFRDTGATWEQLQVNASDLASGTLPTGRLPALTGDVTSSAGSNSITLNTVPLTKGGTGLTAGGSSNQVLGINNAGTAAEYKTIIAGSGVSVTPSAGALTITATGSGGTVTNITAGTGLNVGAGPGGSITGTGTLNIDVGTTTGQIVQVAASNKLPVIDGSNLTNLNAANLSSGTVPAGRLPAFTGDVTSSAGSTTLTLGTVPINKGGTGQVTANAALNALLPSQTSAAGRVLQSNGTDASWVVPNAGTVTSVSGSGPISVATGTTTPAISIAQANTTTSGFLSSTDWNTFNNKATTASLSNYVLKAGDTMSGALTLPSNGLIVGTNQLVVDSGKVGIGTNAPSSPLSVSANSTAVTGGAISGTLLHLVGADATAPTVLFDSFASVPGMVFRRATNTAAAPGAIGGGTTLMTLGGRGHDGTAYAANNQAQLGFYSESAWTTSNHDTRITFQTTPTGSTTAAERMRIDQAGNVGIGTTAPGANLDVSGTIRADVLCDRSGANCKTINTGWTSTGAATSIVSSWPDAIRCTHDSSGNSVVLYYNRATSASEVVYWDAGASYALKFTSAGAYVTNTNLYNGGASNCVSQSLSQLTTNGQTFLLAGGGGNIWTLSGGNANYVGGNVGIGNTAPTERLDVTGKIKGTELCIGADCRSAWPSGAGGTVTSVTSANTDIALTNTTTTPQLTLNSGTGANQILKLNASSEIPAVSGANLTNLNPTSLSSAVPVNKGGTASTSFTANQMVIANGTGSALISFSCPTGNVLKFNASGVAACDTIAGALGYTPANGTNYVAKAGDTMTGTLNLASNGLVVGTNQLVVSGGNVGIGTASPGQKLSVAGTIESTSGGIKFPDGTIQITAGSPTAGNLDIRKGNAPLVSNITISGTTPTYNVNIPVTIPEDTRAVIIGVAYSHGSSTTNTHGYLTFDAYQTGTTESDFKASYNRNGFNDYANTHYTEILVPWRPGLADQVTIQVQSSYNSDTLNRFDISYRGYISGSGGSLPTGAWNESSGNAYRSSGNVGIGISTPTSRLHVRGPNSNMTSSPVNSISLFESGSSANTDYLAIGSPSEDVIALQVGDQASAKILSLNPQGGNVGVGTSAPNSTLSVYNPSESTTLTNLTQGLGSSGINIVTDYTAGAHTPGIFWSTQDNSPSKPKAGIWMFEDGSGTKLHLGTSNNYATGITNQGLTVNNLGNVGIQTTSPSAALEVNGTVKAKQIDSEKGSWVILKLAACGGACGSYHTLNTWTSIGGYGHTPYNNDTSVFSTSNGTVTINKTGTYRIVISFIQVPTADQQTVLACPFINGSVNCGGGLDSDQYKHGNFPAGLWRTSKHEFYMDLAAGTTVAYGYYPTQALNYWSHDGHTGMSIMRMN